jgi:hypothetical protein
MSASSIVLRAARYHFRIRVPSDLAPLVGRKELHRSLRCSDPRQARTVRRQDI